MAGMIEPEFKEPADYRGLKSIFEYTNDDGEMFKRNCGQAAAATLLTTQGIMPALAEWATTRMAQIERTHPPDNLGGLFGTSRRCFVRLCRAYGQPLSEIVGETALRYELENDRPVAVMVGVTGGRLFGFDLPSGHWMVAYGYDEEKIYLSNWIDFGMPWPEFRERWSSWVSRLIGMRHRGLGVIRNDRDTA